MRNALGVMVVLGWMAGACADETKGGSGDGTGATDTTLRPDSDAGATEVALPDVVEDAATETSLPDVAPETVEDTFVLETVDADTGPDIPEPNIAPDNSLCSPAGGDRNIYDLQNPECPDHFDPEPIGTPGVAVALEGVVVTGTFGDTWFVQDPRSGPYSGIAIYNHGFMSDSVERGDVLDLEGNYSEFFENSQVYLTSAKITGTADIPMPYVPAHPSHIATDGPLAEMFEGVLVRVANVATTHTRPDCPRDYGEFEVTGRLRIDNLGFDSPGLPERWQAHIGDRFAAITGNLNFTFGNHKVEPRDLDDLVVIQVGESTGISKCLASECQAAADAAVTRTVVVNEVMADPLGSDTNQEWIELYNPGASPVDMTGWEIRDCGSQRFVMNDGDLVIPAGGYLVVGMSTSAADNGGAPVDVAYGVEGFYLPNTVGAVLLYEGAGQSTLVDQMRYERFDPWDFESGASLERRSATSDGTKPESWKAAVKGYGAAENLGTPGAKNSAQ